MKPPEHIETRWLFLRPIRLEDSAKDKTLLLNQNGRGMYCFGFFCHPAVFADLSKHLQD